MRRYASCMCHTGHSCKGVIGSPCPSLPIRPHCPARARQPLGPSTCTRTSHAGVILVTSCVDGDQITMPLLLHTMQMLALQLNHQHDRGMSRHNIGARPQDVMTLRQYCGSSKQANCRLSRLE